MSTIIKKQQIFMTAILFVVLVGLISSYLLFKNIDFRQSLASEDGVSVFFNPKSISADIHTIHSVDIYMTTNGNEVSATKLQVGSSNTNVLRINSIQSGGGIPIEITKDVRENLATLVLAVNCLETSCETRNGTYKIVTITFTVASAGEAYLHVGDTQISVVNQSNNYLGATQNFTISALAPTPVPTATPTSSPSPTSTPPPPDSPKLITLTPIEDTHVKSSYSNKTYGSDFKIISDGSPRVISLLKYDLTAFDGFQVRKAYVSIMPTKQRKVAKAFKIIDDVSWKENSVTWNTKPVIGESFAFLRESLRIDTEVQIDVTSTVKDYAGGIFSFAIDDLGGGYILETNSKESTSEPIRLLVEFN